MTTNGTALLAAVLLLLFAGCSGYTPQPLLRGSVTYSVSGNEVTVVASHTAYDRTPAARDAYLFMFKKAFEDTLNSKRLLYHYEQSRLGEASEAGYIHGMDEAAAYVSKKKDQAEGPGS